MEALATYLIKSSVWLTGFALVYVLFLRNERFFVLNRIYLVSGILVSIVFPLFTWHYTVLLPVIPTAEVSEPQVQGVAEVSEPFPLQNVVLLSLYILGIIYLTFRILRQTLPVFRIIRMSEKQPFRSAKLIRSAEYPASFSFFSYVFVNPSTDEIETREIVNHEMEHIRQQHWIDLLLFEILRTMQWFNPAIWLYGHLIRQNHEYLADERALQRSSNPAIYRAALLNQLFGGPVISLANSFNYSLNKKRFTMMKHTIKSPFRKLKLLVVLPLIAGVFYAFAAPEYKFIQEEEHAANVTQNEKTVKGKVTDENGKPLKSASVVISGQTIGTITDDDGNFILKLTDNSPIVISYVGFESVKLNSDFDKEMRIVLKTVTIGIDMGSKTSASSKATKPSDIPDNVLVVIDGKESTKYKLTRINPDRIEKIDVIKNQQATEKYGEKAKDGVIEITLKKEKAGTGHNPKEVVVIGYGKMQKENTSQPPGSGFGIRSAGTMNKALIVIDGVIAGDQNVNSIPPETIESISVIKDKSAAILYGENGKDGVILITTKKGNSGSTNNPVEVKVNGFGMTQIDQSMKVFPSNNFSVKTSGDAWNKPLIVLDGVIDPIQNMDKIDPNTIESINVLKGEKATTKYGAIGNNGVLEITLKKPGAVFTMVEEMPQFPGGVEALKNYVAASMNYPTIALENGIEGQVFVKFVVSKTGKATNAKVSRGVDPSLDKEALRIVESMPGWIPGKQQGENVDVTYEIPINFNLPANRPSRQKLMEMSVPAKTSGIQPEVVLTAQNHQLIIVPNPAKDKATITLKGSDSTNKLDISVYDIDGILIKKESRNGPTFSLSFTGFVTGTYLIVAHDGTNQFSGQIVISH